MLIFVSFVTAFAKGAVLLSSLKSPFTIPVGEFLVCLHSMQVAIKCYILISKNIHTKLWSNVILTVFLLVYIIYSFVYPFSGLYCHLFICHYCCCTVVFTNSRSSCSIPSEYHWRSSIGKLVIVKFSIFIFIFFEG